MEMDRRKFLKVCGLGILGLGIVQAENIFAQTRVKPASRALPKRLALVIDTGKCPPGCTDCIAACHETHNVPQISGPDEVKWIWKENFANAFPDQSHQYMSERLEERRYLLLCNHCDNPACVRVCPTGATFKQADGIVMMDYHRCIGCRYCMAACPYGARSFNFKDPRPYLDRVNPAYPTRSKGVVEKCNFCGERIAQGAAPVCTEACKKGALVFGDLNDPSSRVRKILSASNTMQRKPNLGTFPNIYYVI